MIVFDLIVEGCTDDPLEVPSHDLHLRRLQWHEEEPPDVITIGSVVLVKVGRYARPGDVYRYRTATRGAIIEGRLEGRS